MSASCLLFSSLLVVFLWRFRGRRRRFEMGLSCRRSIALSRFRTKQSKRLLLLSLRKLTLDLGCLFISSLSRALLSAVRVQVPAAGGWKASTNVPALKGWSSHDPTEWVNFVSGSSTLSRTDQSPKSNKRKTTSRFFRWHDQTVSKLTMTTIDWSKMKINRTNVVSQK